MNCDIILKYVSAFKKYYDLFPWIMLKNRYLQGLKPEIGEHSFFSEASGSNRGIQMDSPLDNTWPLMQSRLTSLPNSKSNNTTILQNDYPRQSYFGSEFASGEHVKPEGQSLRPFFDEWPKTRDSWSGLEDERSNHTSFSTTQLSISIPMASSDFSATSSQSPHGEFQIRLLSFFPTNMRIPSPFLAWIFLQITERTSKNILSPRCASTSTSVL